MQLFYPLLLLMVFLALIVHLTSTEQTQPSKRKILLSHPKIKLIMSINFVLLLVFSHVNYRYWQAENLFWQAAWLEQNKQWQALLVTSTQSYQLNPYRKRTLAYIAQAQSEMGQHNKAVDNFTKALKQSPYQINMLSKAAIANIRAKQYHQAEVYYQKILTIMPTWDKAHKNLGILLYKYLNRKKDALVHFKKALEINPQIEGAQVLTKLTTTH